MNNQNERLRWWKKVKMYNLDDYLNDIHWAYIILPIGYIIFWLLSLYLFPSWAETYFEKFHTLTGIIGTLIVLTILLKIVWRFKIYNWLKIILSIILIYPSYFIF